MSAKTPPQSDVSRLLRGNSRECPLEHLLKILMALSCNGDIAIDPPNLSTDGALCMASSETSRHRDVSVGPSGGVRI